MAAISSPESSPQPRVYFQTPPETEQTEIPVRKQGRVTVKYDRKELRKRLNLEEWIINRLTDLYDCEVCALDRSLPQCTGRGELAFNATASTQSD
ncbi:PP14B phosphatase, partial [Polyodon spathula]|nr:PP14B phosphatase [Polyodon spathula]